MTPIRILISMVLFVVGINVSAQRPITLPFSSLPMGINKYPMETIVEFNLWSLDPERSLFWESIPHKAASEQDMTSFIVKTLQGLNFDGDDLEGSTWLDIEAGPAGRYLNEDFALRKTSSGWKVPDLNLKLDYGEAGEFIPTASEFEVETADGRIFSLVTLQNDFTDHGCDLLAIRSALKQQGFVIIPFPIASREYPIKRLTIWEETKFVSLNGDGEPLEWSSTPPSFFKAPEPPPPSKPERRPLMVNIRLEIGKLPILVVSGDGSEDAVIEQSRDGIRWGPAISLSSPPRLSSANSGYVYEFARDPADQSGDVAIFYRARLPAEPQNN